MSQPESADAQQVEPQQVEPQQVEPQEVSATYEVYGIDEEPTLTWTAPVTPADDEDGPAAA